MRRALLIIALSAVGCGQCGADDNPGTTTQDTNNQTVAGTCSDADGDGHNAGADCSDADDCDDTDGNTNPTATEQCGDNIDNNCNGETDEGCPVVGPCTDGETRECGADVGRCTSGEQTCEDGRWSSCSGIGAISETCNGIDDNCNGEVDENPTSLCDDGLVCNGISTCEAGACSAPVMLDCSELSGACAEGRCSEKDKGCRSFPLENGITCDDGEFCTDNGTCNSGVCESTPRDCSAETDGCNVGVCDETADACVPQPVSDGTSCDDGMFCTDGDSCAAGACVGAALDCSMVGADQCNTGVCDETADACVPSPRPDGTTCNDGMYCTVGETCQAGSCAGGTPRDCAATGACRMGTCDETTDSCDGAPLPDGTPCDDSLFCTTGESCLAGVCANTTPTDCSALDAACKAGMCNENLRTCVAQNAPDGASCDDGLFCTTATTCTAGACNGSPTDCSSVANACNTGQCNEAQDMCVRTPRSDGTACNDGQFCTTNDACTAGSCGGAARDCSSAGDACNVGSCDDVLDSCVLTTLPNGTACEDGLYCTDSDACVNGSCLGGVFRDCSAAAGGDMCLDGACDEQTRSCYPIDNGTCDRCEDGTPTVSAGADTSVVPNTSVPLNATGTDPTGQPLNYVWSVRSRPTGSSSQISFALAQNTSFLVDLAGTYEVCVTATDSDGCASVEDCMIIEVVPTVSLHVELVWFDDNSDMDLHLQAPPYSATNWFRPLNSGGQPAGNCPAPRGPACYWCVPNPDWGGSPISSPDGSSLNDPILDVDDPDGLGPENINVDVPADGSPYTIGVHYYSDFNWSVTPRGPSVGSNNARIRVYDGPALLFETTRSLTCNQLWEVANVTVSASGTSVTVAAKNSVSEINRGLCRCNSDADCRAGEACGTHPTYGSICFVP